MPDQEVVDSTSIALESLMQVIRMYVDCVAQKDLKKLEQKKSSFSRSAAVLRENMNTEWSERDKEPGRSKTLRLAIDCVARLCKSRPGVPEGLKCLGICPYLARCLRHPRASVRRAAAVSIVAILRLPEARRELIHCFRFDPYLMKSLQLNTKDMKINTDFLDSWQHCQQIGLPKSRPIVKSKQSLFNESSVDFQTDLRGRPISICTQLTGDLDWNEFHEAEFIK
ncbi:hypothetical protein Ciccas_005385 [Cichlidogyrus casuarinus]|uniref:Uncharacterized protein n=1 Tax=Cichlidogyrus casuarinus TaxID=1844966 RepID=A0ABD2Q8W4_9PLAT